MRDVYLIRHGKPRYPLDKSHCIGQTDLPLSTFGQLQAVLLGSALQNCRLTAIFSSPLKRASQTASLLADDCAIRIIPEIAERNLGDWDGLSFDTIRTRWPAIYEKRGIDPDYPIPGAETPARALQRFQIALEQILHRSTGNIAIVSHTDVISSFAFAYDQTHQQRISHRHALRLACGEYYHFSVDSSGKIVEWDLTVHKPQPTLTDALCQKLRIAAALPMHIQAHCDAVASVAYELCAQLSAHGYPLHPTVIHQAALLHDIARLQHNHAQIGSTWIAALGYPEIAALIQTHHELQNSEINDASVLFLADKLVQGSQRVSLEKRFADSVHKCTSPEALQAHELRYRQALHLEKQIHAICSQNRSYLNSNEKI